MFHPPLLLGPQIKRGPKSCRVRILRLQYNLIAGQELGPTFPDSLLRTSSFKVDSIAKIDSIMHSSTVSVLLVGCDEFKGLFCKEPFVFLLRLVSPLETVNQEPSEVFPALHPPQTSPAEGKGS